MMTYVGRHRTDEQEELYEREVREGLGAAFVHRLDRERGVLTIDADAHAALDPALLQAFLAEHNLTLEVEG